MKNIHAIIGRDIFVPGSLIDPTSEEAKAKATEAMDRILAVRARLISSQPFWGYLTLRMAPVIDWGCSTLWTNGSQMGINPLFVGSLSEDEITGGICHEALHPALGHQTRRGVRNHRLWNIACDYVVNSILDYAGVCLPKGALLNHKKYDAMGAEQVYDDLLKQKGDGDGDGDGKGKGKGEGEGSSETKGGKKTDDQKQGTGKDDQKQGNEESEKVRVGDPKDTEGRGELRDDPEPSTSDERQAQWDDAMEKAVKQADRRGKCPGNIKDVIKAKGMPKTNWRTVVRDIIDASTRDETSWHRVNRRFVHAGMYMPGQYSPSVRRIVLVDDTSGSCTGDDAKIQQAFADEVSGIIEITEQDVLVLYADTEVHGDGEEYSRNDFPIVLHPQGMGGTDFRGAFDWVAKNLGERPSVLIYLTDMCGYFPERDPGYPVIWACYGRPHAAPFGRVVRIDKQDIQRDEKGRVLPGI